MGFKPGVHKDIGVCDLKIINTDMFILYIIGQREKSLSGVATYSYTMKPTPTGVVFTEATVQEIHQFTPHYEIGDATQMETRQYICSCTLIMI